ncbi:putative inorganic phosphate cotransporter [Contarinia nasturtii]|uniref:putative inorganic phosphate cotransporter n=1 Tax=Contarinia nasturtii TaxID=265458 RepID=UPI0012D3ACF4|nr:putative inorganic phosphate cotransporter [Contarinia nasturtii]XP_031630364.1 putative inorganic phosphate cotransporter [Contarinia nasturtii]
MDLLYNPDAIYVHGPRQPHKPCFYVPQRYLLTFMGFMGLVMAYCMRLSLSVAITQMVPPPIVNMTNLLTKDGQSEIICPYTDENYVHEHLDEREIFYQLYSGDNDVYNWSQEQQGIILSSFFWGYLTTQLLGGILSQRYGGKYVFAMGILFSAFCSLLTPFVVRSAEATGLIVLRLFGGLGEGVIYAGLTDLLAAWVPLKERTTLASLAYGGSTVGTIGGTYLAAMFIHHFKSWHEVFYIFGVLTIVWCLFFILLCYNDPDCHPFITDYEKTYLLDELGQQQQISSADKKRKQTKRTPWRQILTNVPFIALILCQVSHEWAFCIIVLNLPKYMNDVLHFSIQDNGIYSSIPQVIKLIMALATGAISDWIIAADHLTITSGRRIFVAVASFFTGIFTIAASYAECDKMYVVAYFTISIAFQGVPGVAINSLDLSPNYAGILMGISGTVTSITGILVPWMVGVFAPNSLLSEWRFVFWITFWLQIVKLFVFSIFGSGEKQSWDSYDTDREARFILPGDESDDYLDNEHDTNSSLSSSNWDLFFQ